MLEALDPEVRPLVEGIDLSSLDEESLRQLRSLPSSELPSSEGIERRDHLINSSTGLRALSYRPAGVERDLPCIYFIHGGGFIMGSHVLTAPDVMARVRNLPCVYFSIDYRLAPECPFPGPLEDCYQGLQWLFEHGAELGVDIEKVGVGGASAGGGLAAGLTHAARDRGELQIAFQLLECPMLDDRQRTPSSQLEGLPVWSKQANAFGWRSYLGPLYGRAEIPVTAAPARADDLAGLPPAYLCVGGVDGFRDEVIDYAMRLSQAGVPTDLRVYAGAPHGLHIAAGSRLAERWTSDLDAWLEGRLTR
jgi:acetyl esterase/lipase